MAKEPEDPQLEGGGLEAERLEPGERALGRGAEQWALWEQGEGSAGAERGERCLPWLDAPVKLAETENWLNHAIWDTCTWGVKPTGNPTPNGWRVS